MPQSVSPNLASHVPTSIPPPHVTSPRIPVLTPMSSGPCRSFFLDPSDSGSNCYTERVGKKRGVRQGPQDYTVTEQGAGRGSGAGLPATFPRGAAKDRLKPEVVVGATQAPSVLRAEIKQGMVNPLPASTAAPAPCPICSFSVLRPPQRNASIGLLHSLAPPDNAS